MNISIRPADLDADRNLVVETLRRHLNPSFDHTRFDWLYRYNPYGPGRSWIALDTDDQTVVGVASAFPRRFYTQRGEEIGWVLGDFCVNDQYRSLGPALQLQRACLEEIGAGTSGFCYDFPSVRMMAIYKRLGVTPYGHLVRLTKLLRVDRKIKEIVKPTILARWVSLVGNSLLEFQLKRLEKNNERLNVAIHAGDCSEEFSFLARWIGNQYGACVQRSAEYLNWRYLNNPLTQYEVLTARTREALVAYAVFTQAGENGLVTDLFGIDDSIILRCIVNHVIVILWQRGVTAVNVALLESHPWMKIFTSLGFKARESLPIIIYGSASAIQPNTTAEVQWFLMQGDRDS
jgi:RimJ/RimL family protein N-acetyltransferase